MKIINFTPHTVTVHDGPRSRTYHPCGTVARVSTERRVRGRVGDEEDCMFPISQVIFGPTVDLPPEQKSIVETGSIAYKIYIVSAMVRMANPSRWDLVSPGELIRDEKGVVIGCDGFDTCSTFDIFHPSSIGWKDKNW